ncbi:glycerophosphodiester phosphodiesterase [Bacillaceae bacterium Marseille-Q3522]|nr:glycerophosphodiester phosphodiesterase [Bacillaceae bacterium Marseille-Q3522]
MNINHLLKKVIVPVFIIAVFASIYLYVSRETEAEPAIVDSAKIFAHRGANDRFNESTIPAYKIAAKDGVDALEIDLRMTKDGKLVAMHDESIDRTTNGTGNVSDYNLEELRNFHTVGKYGGRTYSEAVATLAEIFATFTDKEHYYIETRSVNGEWIMEEPLIQLLHEYDLIEKNLVTIQSFSQESLEKVHRLAPDVPLTLLFRKGDFSLREAISSDFPMIGMETSDATMKTVNELHRRGKQVHVFFTNKETEKQEQERVKALNVDGYFTDYILFTKELVSKREDD